MDTPAQLDMFAAALAAVPAAAIYTRYSTKNTRHACARCLLACHEAQKKGTTAPRPEAVAWRRQCGGPDTVQLLCYRHKAEAHAEDTAAGRLAKQAPGSRRTARVTA